MERFQERKSMSDLISRSKLREEAESLRVTVNGLRSGKGILSEYAKHYRESFLKMIDEQPAVVNGWIPVSERLPEDEQKVLVCTLFKYKKTNGEIEKVYNITCAMYESGNLMCENSNYSWDYECRGEYDEEKDDYHTLEGWFEITIMEHEEWTAVGIDREVVAWMPLPEPYKE